jgi:HK97 family phage major capsid protein
VLRSGGNGQGARGVRTEPNSLQVVYKMSVKAKELRQKAVKLSTEGQDMLRAGLDTTERRHKFDLLMDESEKAINEAVRIEREEARTTHVEELERRDKFNALLSGPQKEYRNSFAQYLKRGLGRMDSADVAILRNSERRTDDQAASMWGNVTGQSYSGTSGTQGGVLVPASFQYEVEVAQKYYAPMLNDGVCRVLDTATGAILPFPTSNDTGNKAAVLADATQDSEVSVPLSVVNFGAFKYTSRIIRISVELLQDSAFNLEDFLKERFAERFGRAYEHDFTLGLGTTQPTGIVPAVLASGVTPVISVGANANDGTSAAATSIGSTDLITLEHSVDPAYRSRARYMLSDGALKSIKTILDKYGRPLWQPSLSAGDPATINGYQYSINQSMDSTVAATKNTVLFGDFSKFVIRRVRDMQVLRLDERYADFGQVGFIAFSRVDSNLVDAGTHPLNVLQQHS